MRRGCMRADWITCTDDGGRLKRLAPLPARHQEQQELEPESAPMVARGIAYGYLHPVTHARFPDMDMQTAQQVSCLSLVLKQLQVCISYLCHMMTCQWRHTWFHVGPTMPGCSPNTQSCPPVPVSMSTRALAQSPV